MINFVYRVVLFISSNNYYSDSQCIITEAAVGNDGATSAKEKFWDKSSCKPATWGALSLSSHGVIYLFILISSSHGVIYHWMWFIGLYTTCKAYTHLPKYFIWWYSEILFYGRVKVATKISNQVARFMKDLKMLLLEKVYVVNVLGIFLTCFTTNCCICSCFHLLKCVAR